MQFCIEVGCCKYYVESRGGCWCVDERHFSVTNKSNSCVKNFILFFEIGKLIVHVILIHSSFDLRKVSRITYLKSSRSWGEQSGPYEPLTVPSHGCRKMQYAMRFLKDAQAPGLLLDWIGKIWYIVVDKLYYVSLKFQSALTTVRWKY